ncbi:MAG: aminotransferase class I/II-fold pyridoxal phosphate-dependent enzyme, partial [Thermoguttaceae bacterium]
MRTDSLNIPTRASHGGAVAPGVELDFSTNLNPVPRPKELDAAIRASLDGVGVYPDYRQTAAREAIARFEGVGPSQVFGGNGASELFTALANALNPRRSLVVEPSFIGLRRALEASSVRRVEPFYLREEDGFELTDALLAAITPGVELVSLADPNNPTGRNIDGALLDAILDRCERAGAALAIDESFLRLSKKRAGLAKRAANASNLYVVSSFTKSCVIPGLRVGYLVSNEENV